MMSLHLLARLAVVLPLLLTHSGCHGDPGINPEQPLQIDMYLVNESGLITTSFEKGQIPIVVLEVINYGDEVRLNPAFHYGEHILLYVKQSDNKKLGNFYKNGQVTNEIRPTRFKGYSKTYLKFPWLWTSEIRAKITESDLESKETTQYFPANTFADPLNECLPKGEYEVRLVLPKEWEVFVNKLEMEFYVR
ncbi:hypothetical protein [Pleomorphovibrio marinus]|uniref:hypothetical protein n=1 Tax=Pleomorphovibrio marinus TaxID=2164132 RepID=UPI0013002F46|nr:hypothetical protein [Pleomorphovibrio marinus]